MFLIYFFSMSHTPALNPIKKVKARVCELVSKVDEEQMYQKSVLSQVSPVARLNLPVPPSVEV
jgi:hypothetical protein